MIKRDSSIRKPQYTEQEFYNTVGFGYELPNQRLVSGKKNVKKVSIVDMMM